ncbi:DUF2785 domain-containing protein [Shouchella miscanthi]|uniref:DUF2785 domain-containing protein n=1 Tax=Shouchella miscanthi TaxID=2598861 RepID=UPI001643DD27|nr:DUF2785 domain-containing protein [Shouchella miscanthi]
MILKDNLLKLKENNFKPHVDTNLQQTVEESLKQLGTTDSELRDDLIYTQLSYWIIEGFLKEREIKHLKEKLICNEFLFYRIGEQGTDSIFKRSFSVLLLAPIMYIHNKKSIFSTEEVRAIINKTVDYMTKEIDLRGHVSGKGWAHSIAHTADTLYQLIDHLNREDRIKVLNVISIKFSTHEYILKDEEDERIVNVLVKIIFKNRLKIEDFDAWLNDLSEVDASLDYEKQYTIKSNIKSLIRSLYLRISFLDKENFNIYLNSLGRVLQVIDLSYYQFIKNDLLIKMD